MTKFCSLLSGGKDSNYALYRALMEGLEPACILVAKPLRSDSWMFHVPNVDLALLQVQAMGLEEYAERVTVSGVKEREVEEIAEALRRAKRRIGFDVIVVGAVASRYQYERISRIADELGVDVYAPAWMINQEDYMRLLVKEGFQFIITKISTLGLPPRLMTTVIDYERVEEIIRLARKYGFNPSFEGGEAETLVLKAPHYKKTLCVEGSIKQVGPYEYELDVVKAWLSDAGEPRNCLSIYESFTVRHSVL
ncbi:MAG: diphthine--ammonia ligase [Desulfurococcales archaeon]|nr:diphthine--ammonia ligase [Desulfurococcales archaeon]